jgi:menaquinone-dependent protoporphyrinogen oxidase
MVCIIYSSTDGQTKKISEKLNVQLNTSGIQTELFSIENFECDISRYKVLIIGASIRYGKHHTKVIDFISKHNEELKKIQTAFFSVNLVARKQEKNAPETNPYMIKFLKSIKWKPDFAEVFAGKLDYKAYGFWDSLMIKLIMKLTNGPTRTEKPIEYTNWDKVHQFGLKIIEVYKKHSI